jgi:hypothetical protein
VTVEVTDEREVLVTDGLADEVKSRDRVFIKVTD